MQIDITENSSDYDIETYSKEYVEKYIGFIKNNIPKGWRDDAGVGLRALKEFLVQAIKKSCYSFINNKHDPKYLEQYLFPTLKYTCKGAGKNIQAKKSYNCPGCTSINKTDKLEPVQILVDHLSCNNCMNNLNDVKFVWEEYCYGTFANHSKSGFKCNDCERFIPDNNFSTIKCPYPDCFFVGKANDMNVMPHPRIRYSFEDNITDGVLLPSRVKTDTKILIQDNINEYIRILNECIDDQINSISYKGHDITYINKLCMYDAFKNLIKTSPESMISYLIFTDRGLHIQSKIFQEFISILEQRIPFEYVSRDKKYTVSSLTDENLSIFSGKCKFNAVVDNKLNIPNNTKEIYVGGRKASYCRPYYIGKILDIVDVDKNISITNSIKEFTFSKIMMKDNIKPGTSVIVEHLYIPPHYQMGGMVYLNRIRRSIVDKVYFKLNGKKREPYAQNTHDQF